MKECIICNRKFEPKSNHNLICSLACLKVRKKQNRRKHYLIYKEEVIKEATNYNKEHPEKRKEIVKRYYYKNREKILLKQKEYYNKSPNKKESLRKYKRSVKGKLAEARYRKTRKRKMVLEKYNKSDKGIITNRLRTNRRNEKKKNLNELSGLSRKQIQLIFKLYNNKCFNCGKKEKLEIEHFYPLSRGYGLSYNKFNVCILCRSCNAKKNNKLPEDFYNKTKLKEFNKIKLNFLKGKDCHIIKLKDA